MRVWGAGRLAALPRGVSGRESRCPHRPSARVCVAGRSADNKSAHPPRPQAQGRARKRPCRREAKSWGARTAASTAAPGSWLAPGACPFRRTPDAGWAAGGVSADPGDARGQASVWSRACTLRGLQLPARCGEAHSGARAATCDLWAAQERHGRRQEAAPGAVEGAAGETLFPWLAGQQALSSARGASRAGRARLAALRRQAAAASARGAGAATGTHRAESRSVASLSVQHAAAVAGCANILGKALLHLTRALRRGSHCNSQPRLRHVFVVVRGPTPRPLCDTALRVAAACLPAVRAPWQCALPSAVESRSHSTLTRPLCPSPARTPWCSPSTSPARPPPT